jgi:uncharacterized membrane protein
MGVPLADLHLPTPAWWFYALGPQLVICLAFGYWTARRRGCDLSDWRHSKATDWHSLIDWLTIAFLASLVPLAGVVLMLWLWRRSPHEPPRTLRVADDPAAEPRS